MRNMPMPRFVLSLFLLAVSTTGLNSAGAEDFMARGRDLEARTLYGPAMAEYQRAIKEDPANAAEAHYRIGVLSNRLGNTEGAVQEFQAALQLNPNHAEARAAVAAFYVNRGAAARQQHRPDEALRELQEADEGQFLHEAAVEMFRDMDQREAENARCKPGEVWQTDLGMQAKVRPCPLP